MNESRHTPGPWMLCPNTEIQTADGFVVIGYVSRNWLVKPPQDVANGLLMAAAPEMLEALKAQEAVDEHVANCEDCCDGCHPELCEDGFPIADTARLLRRAVLEKLQSISSALNSPDESLPVTATNAAPGPCSAQMAGE